MSGRKDKNKESDLDAVRHSLAHLLAAAVMELWPDTKRTIGPAIDNGFYYDFDFSSAKPTEQHGSTRTDRQIDAEKRVTISDRDLPRIEAKMREIMKTWETFARLEVNEKTAQKVFEGNEYKLELIDEILQKDETLTLYYSGPKSLVPSLPELETGNWKLETGFLDLCRGGHVESMIEVEPQSFKLDCIAGAYWRGDEKNKMLTRIYGLAFATKQGLEDYLVQREEVAKRDHRKLGQDLDLFTFSDLVGAGLPLFTPKGTVIRTELQNALLEISKKYEMLPVTIPHIAKRELYEISGHAGKFGDELFRVVSHYNQEFVMKPVNCPHHTQIYASRPRSYRDLPLRYMESTMQYRDEKPGEIGGLTRVRSITVDDGHIFCMVDQIKQEAKNIANIIEEFYTELGLWGNHWVSLSVRDPQNLEKYIGETPDWEQAELMLKEVSDELELDAKRMEGEAALYGPKLDYMFKDSLGHERQLATIQVDFAMPKRFKLTYIDSDGTQKNPVIIHRAILGSYERFLAILIEHFAGAFPVWLSPVQVVVLPISDKVTDYAQKVVEELKSNSIRYELDDRNESIGKKIREAEMQKTPYLLVVGEKEAATDAVSVRKRGAGDLGQTKLNEFLKNIKKEIEKKA